MLGPLPAPGIEYLPPRPQEQIRQRQKCEEHAAMAALIAAPLSPLPREGRNNATRSSPLLCRLCYLFLTQ